MKKLICIISLSLLTFQIYSQCHCENSTEKLIKSFNPTKEKKIWLQRDVHKFNDYNLKQLGCLSGELAAYFKNINFLLDSSQINLLLSSQLENHNINKEWCCEIPNVNHFSIDKTEKFYRHNTRVFYNFKFDEVEGESKENLKKMKYRNKKAKQILRLSMPIIISEEFVMYYYEIGYRPLHFTGTFVLLKINKEEIKKVGSYCGWVS